MIIYKKIFTVVFTKKYIRNYKKIHIFNLPDLPDLVQ